jgi:hypothetical protein
MSNIVLPSLSFYEQETYFVKSYDNNRMQLNDYILMKYYY